MEKEDESNADIANQGLHESDRDNAVGAKQKDAVNGSVTKPAVVYNELPISIKVNLIRDYETQNCSQRSLARKYKVARATVNQIIKQKQRYLAEWDRMKFLAGSKAKANSVCFTLKRFRKTNIASVNHMMEEFIEAARINKWEITGPKLKQRAREIAQQLGLNEFKASNGWLDSFKKRCALELGGSSAEKKKRKNKAAANTNETNRTTVTFPQNSQFPAQTVTDTLPYTVEISQTNVTTPTSWVINYPQTEIASDNETNNAIGTIVNTAAAETVSITPVSPTMTILHSAPNLQVNASKQKKIQMKSQAKKKALKVVKKSSKVKIHKIASHCDYDSEEEENELKVPHISRVRDAIDTLERFAITKMSNLLPSILQLRQEIGNFVIQQQIQNQAQQNQSIEHILANDSLSQDQQHTASNQQLVL
ncbi:uncharacterized protein B4U79_16533 [Dinothrombium tinctorium]|uniref:HTH CENPB-type domain-containing protein n=1 Tax=Dinothrombium tinctorium TaxID=1965070 RepID=A0A3S3NYY4_9ACAR|nr:uncharacterized protein B4U79_16755 [Dinothrombium tinctorium]RWS01440.1 uncharacterized protein B4U79_16729 [Dinothrombium tinctorium]RWS01525.1 uncharacterized protein B4U79_16722 [Dinothrombium tinctorium]RWS03240.1 uncharacterized protein B4U79_16533 [Dinothrombium tinctorium]